MTEDVPWSDERDWRWLGGEKTPNPRFSGPIRMSIPQEKGERNYFSHREADMAAVYKQLTKDKMKDKEDELTNGQPTQNKQRVLMLSSRGITSRYVLS